MGVAFPKKGAWPTSSPRHGNNSNSKFETTQKFSIFSSIYTKFFFDNKKLKFEFQSKSMKT